MLILLSKKSFCANFRFYTVQFDTKGLQHYSLAKNHYIPPRGHVYVCKDGGFGQLHNMCLNLLLPYLPVDARLEAQFSKYKSCSILLLAGC